MQSVYQIPSELLEAHVSRLSTIPVVQSRHSYLHALLFLSGLRVTFFYYRAARAGDEFFTNWGMQHILDDGLDSTARICLKSLMREARSRLTRDGIKIVYPSGAPNPNWAAISIAFATVFEHSTNTVSAWIARGDADQNKLRLSCGMGVVASWSPVTAGFVHDLMRDPLNLEDDVASAIQSFTLTRDKALPELP